MTVITMPAAGLARGGAVGFHGGIGRNGFGGPRIVGGPVGRGFGRGGLGRVGFGRVGLGRGRFGRGRGYGWGGYGFGGYGVGDYGFAFDGAGLPYGAGASPDGDLGPGPGFAPAAFPAPPVCPVIISVGAGLRHPARTRVVYGREPLCRR